ncbi:BgTH12-07804 [Blumeria graminis f. sp. triticale]|uniref:BgTH12-07804 n=1 Tax=Blumeria graminis f. sp. triticale TaxID=1689686 RepID=A0A9W4D9F8_BLUGR|nr:BgTH12-07804 [Blumeria graminis f. sp. triticale]
MKFLSAEYYAAWAGLLLLVPAVYARPHFKCGKVIAFTLNRLISIEEDDGFTMARPNDPSGPNGEEYLSHRYITVPEGGFSTTYLAQVIDEYPYFRAFERTTQIWKPCVFIED